MTNIKDARLISYGHFVGAYHTLHRKIGESFQKQTGFPCAWFEILLLIGQSEEGHLKMSELAEDVLLTTGGITRLIDRMVGSRLVQRVPCPTDRRIQWVVLTEQGKEQLDRAIDFHLKDLEQYYVSPFTKDEFEQFDGLLNKLRTPSENEGD